MGEKVRHRAVMHLPAPHSPAMGDGALQLVLRRVAVQLACALLPVTVLHLAGDRIKRPNAGEVVRAGLGSAAGRGAQRQQQEHALAEHRRGKLT